MIDMRLSETSQNTYDSEMLVASSRGGVSFRSLLNNTYQALSSLNTSAYENGLCISNVTDKDCVLFINTPSFNHEYFSIYFAMELKSALNNDFVCVFDNSILLNNDVMRSVVDVMKQKQQITVVVSHENIISVGDKDTVLKNYNRNLVFLNGNTPYTDLQCVLSSYGQYTHIQPMANKTSPPKLFFTLYSGDGEAPLPYARDRVLLQEEYGNEALLKGGSSSEIIITKTLLR